LGRSLRPKSIAAAVEAFDPRGRATVALASETRVYSFDPLELNTLE
jgi:hypothetical protein